MAIIENLLGQEDDYRNAVLEKGVPVAIRVFMIGIGTRVVSIIIVVGVGQRLAGNCNLRALGALHRCGFVGSPVKQKDTSVPAEYSTSGFELVAFGKGPG